LNFTKNNSNAVLGWGTMLRPARSQVRFPTRLLHFFNSPIPSSCTMTLGSTQPRNRNEYQESSGCKGLPARSALQPYSQLWADCLENLGAYASHKPMCLHGLLQG
jgi:hypothetical protein